MSGRSEPENTLRDSVLSEGSSEFKSSSVSQFSLSFCTPPSHISSSSPCGKPGSGDQTAGSEFCTAASSPNSKALKLDLPVVYNNFKFSQFRCTTPNSFLVTKQRRRPKDESLANSLRSLSIQDDRDNSSSSATGLIPTPGLDSMLRNLKNHKKKLGEKKQKSGKQQQQSKDKDEVWNDFATIFHWAREHTLMRSDQVERLTQDWEDYENGKKTVGLKEIADLLSLTSEQLRNFDLDDCLSVKLTSVVGKLRNLISHYAFSDLMKILSFRQWQQSHDGNLSKCAYYLSEAHGTHFKSEVVDKHCLFFCKKEEMNGENGNTNGSPSAAHDRMRKKVFVRQIKDAITFGKKYEEYESCLSEINPNWNIIQLTAMSFGCNRFASELADFRVTPPLFLTAFQQIPGDNKRSSYVAYVKEPKNDNTARMPHGILEEFKKVMTKNLHINDDYNGCRKKYWDIRAEHNKHLSDILDAIEENWLCPYTALLPGNVKDLTVQKKIVDALTEIQNVLGPKAEITSARVYLYKLIENYNMQSLRIKLKLKDILTTLLPTSAKRAGMIADIIKRVGSNIPAELDRWPTILILDSELEQLPWDWIPSLRSTSVTRMPSIAAIYTAIKVVKIHRPRYPEIVDISKCTYILNPDLSLTNVQKRLELYLSGNKKWTGIIARKPNHNEMEEALQSSDVMLYCGHGSGITFFPEFALQKLLCNATPILMGCSSAQYRYNGPKANSSSIVTSYLIAASPSIVGFLWEVTDVECDRVTVDLVQRWLPGSKRLPSFPQFNPKLDRPREKCLATAVLRSRKAATQFLTEAAIVNYGLPIETR